MTLIAAIDTRDGLVIAADRRWVGSDGVPGEIRKLFPIGNGFAALSGSLPTWWDYRSVLESRAAAATAVGTLDGAGARDVAVELRRSFAAGLVAHPGWDIGWCGRDQAEVQIPTFFHDQGRPAVMSYRIVVQREPADVLSGRPGTMRCDLKARALPLGSLSTMAAWGSGMVLAAELRDPASRHFAELRQDAEYRRFAIDGAPREGVSAEEAKVFLCRYARDFVAFGGRAYHPAIGTVGEGLDIAVMSHGSL